MNRFVKCAEFDLRRVGINAYKLNTQTHKIGIHTKYADFARAAFVRVNKMRPAENSLIRMRETHTDYAEIETHNTATKAFYKMNERRVACSHRVFVCVRMRVIALS